MSGRVRMSEGLIGAPVGQGFSMGRVVSGTFGVLGRRLVPIGVVAVVVTLVTEALAFGLGALMGAEGVPLATITSVSQIWGGVLSLVIGSVASAAITRIVVGALDGEEVEIGSAFGDGMRLMFPLAGLGVVLALGIGLASLLLLVPGVMLAMRWAVATPARVMEGPTVSRALGRSAELTSGYRWPLFFLSLAVVLLAAALTFGLGFVLVGAGGGTVVVLVVQAIASMVSTAVWTTGIAVCYAELRGAKEGATASQLAAVFS